MKVDLYGRQGDGGGDSRTVGIGIGSSVSSYLGVSSSGQQQLHGEKLLFIEGFKNRKVNESGNLNLNGKDLSDEGSRGSGDDDRELLKTLDRELSLDGDVVNSSKNRIVSASSSLSVGGDSGCVDEIDDIGIGVDIIGDVDMTEDWECESMSVAGAVVALDATSSGRHGSVHGGKTKGSHGSSSISFSGLDFMTGVTDKGKRRSDRYDSSESSDSGVATLSPSTSDSPELISPYSPCDFSPEPSDISSSVSSSPLSSTSPIRDHVGSLTFEPQVEQSSSSSSSEEESSSSESSSSSSSSSCSSTTMTAVSSALDTQTASISTSKIHVTNFISFQIPTKQQQQQSTSFSNNNNSSNNKHNTSNAVKKTTTTSKSIGSTVRSSPGFHCDVKTHVKKTNNSNNNNKTISSGIKRKTAIESIFAALKFNPDKLNKGKMPDLSTAEFQPVVKVPDLRGAKSFILHEKGQRNKVIILSVPPSPTAATTSTTSPTTLATATPFSKIMYESTLGGSLKKPSHFRDEDGDDLDSGRSNSPARKKPRLENVVVPISLQTSTLLQSTPTLLPPDFLSGSVYSGSCKSGSPKKTDSSATAKEKKEVSNLNSRDLLTSVESLVSSSSVPDLSSKKLLVSPKSPKALTVVTTSSKNQNQSKPPQKQQCSSNNKVLLQSPSLSSSTSASHSNSSSSNNNNNRSNSGSGSISVSAKLLKISSDCNLVSSSLSSISPSLSLSSSLVSSSTSVVAGQGQNSFSKKAQLPKSQPVTPNSNSNNSSLVVLSSPISTAPLLSFSSNIKVNCKVKVNSSSTNSASLGNSNTKTNNSNSTPRKRKLQNQNQTSSSGSSCSRTDSEINTELVEGLTDSVSSVLSTNSSTTSISSGGSSSISSGSVQGGSSAIISLFSSSDSRDTTSTNSSTSSSSSNSFVSVLSKVTKSKQQQQLLSSTPINNFIAPTANGFRCQWMDCVCTTDANINILEHIQAVHVAPQINMDGYICLWEGCKVFNKKSCSLSWLERHVLSHGGNKPFKCIIPGCGLSFGSQGALERHVNSHISNNGGMNGTCGPNGSLTNRKVDASPSKSARRKKQKLRKQRHSIGQHVDFFDKHTMEVIKYRLVTARRVEHVDQHDCVFRSEVLNWRFSANEEPHCLVRWSPSHIYPDEWIPESKYEKTKVVPFRSIPRDKIKILYPNMFPPERKEKARRKWKPSSSSSSSSTSSSLPPSSFSSAATSTCSSNFSSASSESSFSLSSTSTLEDFGGGLIKLEVNSPESPPSECLEDDSYVSSEEEPSPPVPDWIQNLAMSFCRS